MVNSRSLALCLLLFSLASQSDADITGRIHVVDGDTIRVSGQVIRLFGVDAPEVKQTCQTSEGLHWACGAWVSDVLRNAFDGQEEFCVEVEQDRYGRSVARCEVAGVDLGRWLVQRGLAFSYRKYSMDYDLDEKRAAVNDRGLHATRVQNPADFRAASAQAAQKAPDIGCQIKGNISSKGVRIYHLRGQEQYERTRISTLKGERWFCSEAEAKAAGWRRARR